LGLKNALSKSTGEVPPCQESIGLADDDKSRERWPEPVLKVDPEKQKAKRGIEKATSRNT
jgi:hypothetical protein